MWVYSLLLSGCLYVAHSQEPDCGTLKAKKGCRSADHCEWKNSNKKCFWKAGFATPKPTSKVSPTEIPTSLRPTMNPTVEPTESPTKNPTIEPTESPTKIPTSLKPTINPTIEPTTSPTPLPSSLKPTTIPSVVPTTSPSNMPTSLRPTTVPSVVPTTSPSPKPTTLIPTKNPTEMPTNSPPTEIPTTLIPTMNPTETPNPTDSPTETPNPTESPTETPNPTESPTETPNPTESPTETPNPTESPTESKQTVDCSKIRNKNICRLDYSEHCYYMNSKKKCMQKEGVSTPNPTQSNPTEAPTSTFLTAEPTPITTEMPTPPQSTNPTQRQTSKPTAEATPNPTHDKNNRRLCSAYDKNGSGNFRCTRFVDGNIEDDVFEALMGCSNGPNCSAKNSGKVDRTSSKYCNHNNELGDMDLIAEEMAIRSSMLNGMSSKCNRWCLFDVHAPFGRSWLWDMNGKCWKKQGNRGKCQKMSNSVRRPKEIGVVVDRVFGICDIPKKAPRAAWNLSRKRESCSDTCDRIYGGELKCSAEGIESVHNGRSEKDIQRMFAKAGITQCKRFVEGNSDQAFPAYDSFFGQCASRHPGAVEDPCDQKIGDNYRRLCVCVSWPSEDN